MAAGAVAVVGEGASSAEMGELRGEVKVVAEGVQELLKSMSASMAMLESLKANYKLAHDEYTDLQSYL